ncbi:Uncharacterized protein APZ42_010133, partial [Daphnia magna]
MANQDQAGRGEFLIPDNGPDNDVHPPNLQQNVPLNVQGVPNVPPVIHVGNFKERDPPVFRGLPHEDVMEWIHQFQRVSAFNQ